MGKLLDPEGTHIDCILSRENCLVVSDCLIKDLRVISNRDLKSLIIVDNSVVTFCQQLDNGIPITTFNGDKNDNELQRLLPYLKSLATSVDVREPLKRDIALSAYYASLLQQK